MGAVLTAFIVALYLLGITIVALIIGGVIYAAVDTFRPGSTTPEVDDPEPADLDETVVLRYVPVELDELLASASPITTSTWARLADDYWARLADEYGNANASRPA